MCGVKLRASAQLRAGLTKRLVEPEIQIKCLRGRANRRLAGSRKGEREAIQSLRRLSSAQGLPGNGGKLLKAPWRLHNGPAGVGERCPPGSQPGKRSIGGRRAPITVGLPLVETDSSQQAPYSPDRQDADPEPRVVQRDGQHKPHDTRDARDDKIHPRTEIDSQADSVEKEP